MGTTNSAISIIEGGKPVIIPVNGGRIVPSIVGYNKKGEVILGTYVQVGSIMLCYVNLCYVMLYYVMLCYVMLCYGKLFHIRLYLLYYIILHYIILYDIILHNII